MAFPSTARKSNTSVKSSSSTFASSSASAFSSPPIHYFRKSTTRGYAAASPPPPPPSQSVKFGFECAGSPSRSISAVSRDQIVRKDGSRQQASSGRRMCMCSPTTHPGSFRCSLHKNSSVNHQVSSSSHHRLNARRSAMTNSLVRIGTVEGDLVKRALAALIRPSSHQQRRRTTFMVRPSRLSVMSRADDESS